MYRRASHTYDAALPFVHTANGKQYTQQRDNALDALRYATCLRCPRSSCQVGGAGCPRRGPPQRAPGQPPSAPVPASPSGLLASPVKPGRAVVFFAHPLFESRVADTDGERKGSQLCADCYEGRMAHAVQRVTEASELYRRSSSAVVFTWRECAQRPSWTASGTGSGTGSGAGGGSIRRSSACAGSMPTRLGICGALRACLPSGYVYRSRPALVRHPHGWQFAVHVRVYLRDTGRHHLGP